MRNITAGQRWISDNDVALGLGIVKSVDLRTVEIQFPASSETRTYAKDNAPLTRVEFEIGDSIESIDGWQLTVSAVEDVDGTLRYHGTRDNNSVTTLHECELSDEIAFNLPQEKLFAGQFDDNTWFELRAATMQHLANIEASPTYGLHGARASLIDHQIYIANEVSSRISPRVLLADEVGRGKTIEAGLILHRLLLTGKISRALIIVPEPLLHQWLVELLRRFNLRFSLIDDSYFIPREDADEFGGQTDPVENPFDGTSLVLCGLDFVCRDEIAMLAGECDWDMLIVDEAHHLQWSPQEISREYRQVERLANRANSVLLLTATPEQLGAGGHFARLRLLDPARFHSLETFLIEQGRHAQTADLVNALLENQPLSSRQIRQLRSLGDDKFDPGALDDAGAAGEAECRRLIDRLIDQHGTGRVLFRNTRASIRGFPQRRFIPDELADDKDGTRIAWLADKLREIAPLKVLLICSTAGTATSIAKNLSQKHGLLASVFHEQMSIVERDRAAAWFADTEDGVRILICSEIGSEGRNFQYLHHIVLFDLPDNPDLLEQRIGRLDRIGQRHDICIHVPAAAGTRESRLRDWYHQALNAFEQSCVTGQYVATASAAQFDEFLAGGIEDETAFIEQCKNLHGEKMKELEGGRNRLLEFNACRKDVVRPLVEQIEKTDRDNDLPAYLEQAFDCYGVEIEDHSTSSWIVKPGDHLQVDRYPEIPEDGMTVTTVRETALAREDMHFLTWEHPMVRATFDLILNGDKGTVSVCALKMPQLPARSILLEALFASSCPAPQRLSVQRYLPHNALRVLLDQRGINITNQLLLDDYSDLLESIDREVALQMIDMTRATLKTQVQQIEQVAERQLAGIRSASLSSMRRELDGELQRLVSLKKCNPAIRDEEIQQLENKIDELELRLSGSTLKLSALRVIYTH